jgi:hypothetical protein
MLVSPDGSHLTPEFAQTLLPQIKKSISILMAKNS